MGREEGGMSQINTVTGPIDSAALGVTLSHEHLLIGWPGWQLDESIQFDRDGHLDRLSEELRGLKRLGVSTLVDPCPIDIGRDVPFMAEVSRRSGVQIVCATGLYHSRLGIPSYWQMRSVEDLTDIFVRELVDGIGRSGIRAGLLKVATGVGRVTGQEEKCLRAAARAHRATGCPIMTHTDEGSLGLEQLDILESEGADLTKVVVGHSCGTGDLRYHLSILERGAWLGFDRIGRANHMSDTVRAAALAGLLSSGYADRILISQDHVGAWCGRPTPLAPGQVDLDTNRRYDYLFQGFLPLLQARGLTGPTVEQLLVANPRDFFRWGEEKRPT